MKALACGTNAMKPTIQQRRREAQSGHRYDISTGTPSLGVTLDQRHRAQYTPMHNIIDVQILQGINNLLKAMPATLLVEWGVEAVALRVQREQRS